MSSLRLVSGLATVALLVGAVGAAGAAVTEPVYVAGGQYTASFDQSAHRWNLMPLDGQDVLVEARDARCEVTTQVPQGVWLVGRDAQGLPELVAPSDTVLPQGHSGRIPLRVCGEDAVAGALNAPRSLVEWLATNAGAIYVDR